MDCKGLQSLGTYLLVTTNRSFMDLREGVCMYVTRLVATATNEFSAT